MKNEIITCACGCNQTLARYDNRGRERRFISGHNSYKYRNPQTKSCTRCGETKPIEQFSKSPWGYSSWCKLCFSDYSKNYYSKNREHIKAKALVWNQKNVVQKRIYNQERGQRLRNETRERARIWAKNNPTKRKAQYHKREARKHGNGGMFTDAQWIALCNKYDNKCLKCGSSGPLQADHIVPLAHGGTSDISNIQPLCGPCNFHKHLTTVDYRPFR